MRWLWCREAPFFGGPAVPRATMRRHTRGRTHVRAAARTRTTSCAPCVFSAHHRRLSAPHITTNHPGTIGIGVSNCAQGTRLSFRKNTGVGVGSVSFRKDTPTRAQREHHPDARRPAHSRRRARTVHPNILTCRQTRRSSTRALVVVVLGGGFATRGG